MGIRKTSELYVDSCHSFLANSDIHCIYRIVLVVKTDSINIIKHVTSAYLCQRLCGALDIAGDFSDGQ